MNSIPNRIIQKCGIGYIKRLKKVIELQGKRLEPYHLNLIQKELDNEQGELNEGDEKKLPMRIIYNDKRLGILKKRNCKFKKKN